MPTPPNTVNHERLSAVLARWEQAVYANTEDNIGDDVDAVAKELTESRDAVLDLLRDARVVAENPDSPRWEYVIGKALKDYATALMGTLGKTRAEARDLILHRIAVLTAELTAVETRTMCTADTCHVGCTIAPLDHLPEGSH